MLKTKYKPLDRVAFKTLREAKKIIKDEFDQDLSLHDENVLDVLYEFAMEAQSEELYNIFNKLSPGATQIVETSAPVPRRRAFASRSKDSVKVGDVISGKRCVSMYRGKPVFEAA